MSKNIINVSQAQHSNFPKNLTHSTIVIASQNSFSFGSQSIIDLKVRNIKIHELILNFNTNACSGVTSNGTYPYLNSAFSFFQKLEILINGQVMDTIYADSNFLLNQLFYCDEQRLLNNYAAGSYTNIASRYTLTNTNNSNWYVNLKSLFNQCHFALLSTSHEVQLRITMQPLANVINQGALVGTPVVNINSVSLLARVTNLDIPTSNQLLLSMNKTPLTNRFLSTRYMMITQQAGVTNTTIVMTSIVGNIHSLYFVVRPVSGLTGSTQYTYTPILNFQILDSAGSNINGGTVIPSSFNLLQQQKWWCQSTFPAESFTGVNQSNVYMYSFSVDPISSHANGSNYSSRRFSGNEQLLINFTTALASVYQIDLFAMVESGIQQSATACQLISI